MQEFVIHVHDGIAVIADDETMLACDFADVGEFGIEGVAEFLQGGDMFSGATASTMRSCASESQISHGARPGYLSLTFFSSTSQPI